MTNRLQPIGRPRQPPPQQVQRVAPAPQNAAAARQQNKAAQPPIYEDQPWREISPGILGSVQKGHLCLKVELSNNPPTSVSGKADMLAATNGWKKLDDLLGQGHGLSVSVTRRRSRKA